MTAQAVHNETAPAYGATPHLAHHEQAVIREALEIIEHAAQDKGECFTDASVSRDYFRLRLADRQCEVFAVAFLDNRHRLIACEELFRGTIDGAGVYPREVVREALKHNAAAMILAHNHPSGVAEPSRADRTLTERLAEALALVDVRILDHVVVGDNDTASFAERGWL